MSKEQIKNMVDTVQEKLDKMGTYTRSVKSLRKDGLNEDVDIYWDLSWYIFPNFAAESAVKEGKEKVQKMVKIALAT